MAEPTSVDELEDEILRQALYQSLNVSSTGRSITRESIDSQIKRHRYLQRLEADAAGTRVVRAKMRFA